MVISPESFISSKSSGCILMYCTTHGSRYRTQFTVFFKLISISAVHQPSSLLYVGSTAVGAAKRHLNRMAVYRRLKKTEFVDAELSLRYWASHDNLFQFALVPLRSYENYQLAWVAEHELIAQWQTPLNFPRAMALIKKTALGFRISSKKRASMDGTFGLRLWRKLHKRMHRRSPRFFIKDSRELAWGLPFKLGSRTRAAFETSKLLRSRQTADEEVYALIKLSRNIENPHRNRVQGLLTRVVKFRKRMHWPRTSRSLGVLPLCQPQFTSECEKWLFSSTNICFLRVPTNSLREVPHQSIKKFLHNFQPWEETTWDPAFQLDSVPCPVPSFGASFRTSVLLQAMLLKASNNSKLCYRDVAVSLRPVPPALFFLAAVTG